MRRTFASEAEFSAWHENAKTTLGMPIVGVNAATGQPAPEKQQTTDLTSVGPAEVDVEGNVIDPTLVATITDDSLAARGFQDKLIRADLLTTDEIATLANQYPAWATGTQYAIGDLRAHGGTLWKCVQAHASQSDWSPPVVPALWTHAAPANVIPEWVQPQGAHDAHQVGDRVTHNGSIWVCTVPNNVWQPGVYGWTRE